ncbi:hypothetical protein AAHA92_22051 [Salvia divinorum]|uniref:Uncharacterized protein n=1 Tax=Salvia divinorum TaxID=28513 RepID=A0ABD1GMW5_SALDI
MGFNNSRRASAFSALFIIVLVAAANAASPYNGGHFDDRKNEITECTLLCVNQYLCSCNVSDFYKRNRCCQEYCKAKCGDGAIGSCGDLPTRPNC